MHDYDDVCSVLGSDYEMISTTLWFPSGSVPNRTECVLVRIIEDLIVEREETFAIAASGGEFFPQSTANIAITDNDGMYTDSEIMHFLDQFFN